MILSILNLIIIHLVITFFWSYFLYSILKDLENEVQWFCGSVTKPVCWCIQMLELCVQFHNSVLKSNACFVGWGAWIVTEAFFKIFLFCGGVRAVCKYKRKTSQKKNKKQASRGWGKDREGKASKMDCAVLLIYGSLWYQGILYQGKTLTFFFFSVEKMKAMKIFSRIQMHF